MKKIEKPLRLYVDTIRWKRRGAKVLAWTLVFALLTPMLGRGAARAEEPPEDTGLCVHHPQHTEECGYVEAREGSPCKHKCDESCGGYVPPEEPAEPAEPTDPDSGEPSEPAGPEGPDGSEGTEPAEPAAPDGSGPPC